MTCLCDCGICKCEHGFSRTAGKAKQLAKHVGESALLNDAHAVVLKSFLIAAALHLNKTVLKRDSAGSCRLRVQACSFLWKA